ncbi:MAG TPA: thioesterase family protein [Saprospiraceae bacterium]|nr:thioesterase family protein [Saprospiraceae bacterium]HMQ84867.1 thioesterase family protein [Saprospiraceae bacterium]
MHQLALQYFPLKTYDKIRYADTDRQGHVNNAAFSTFLETGRVEFLYGGGQPLHLEEASFVIASLQLQFKQELTWPGTVEIGTGLLCIGNSSVTLLQGLFQYEVCVAVAETSIVQVLNKTGKSIPLSEHTKQVLAQWLLKDQIK